MAKQLSYCAAEARRHDRDRFLCALFAPADRREDLFALLAFNQEIAKTREIVSEPLLGEMRLQWWREAVGKIYEVSADLETLRGNHVIEALVPAIRGRGLSRELFEKLIEGRIRDLDPAPPPDHGALIEYAEATSSALSLLMLEVLGLGDETVSEPDRAEAISAARAIGIGWAILGQIRALSATWRQGRIFLPATDLAAAGWRAEASPMAAARLPDVVKPAAALAAAQFEAARAFHDRIQRRFLPALLPAALARGYLARLRRVGYDPLDGRLELGTAGRQIRLYVSALRGVY